MLYSKQIAQSLLDIDAVKININTPFKWASGWNSPIYCDNRVILSYPKIRKQVVKHFVELINDTYAGDFVIAGVATGGIGVAALVADAMDKPMVYVRAEAKKHGRQNQIEGKISPNSKVVVIEDLVSTGMSSLAAVSALRSADIEVLGLVSIFDYGFEVAKQNFAADNCNFKPLTNYTVLVNLLRDNDKISQEELDNLMLWRDNPSEWK